MTNRPAWDWHLVLLHSPADVLIFLAYSVISLTAIYIYRAGHLCDLPASYPRLWWLGSALIGVSALLRLGSIGELWIGGVFYWIMGCIKIVLAAIALSFAVNFWRQREEFLLISMVLREVRRHPERD